MKRFLTAGVLLLCLMSSQFARADENRDAKIKAEMVQNYLLWQEAWKNRDAGRIISFESPDFKTVLQDGTVFTKSYSDDSWRDTIETIKKVYIAHVEIKRLTIEPNRIVVLSTHSIVADTRGRSNQQQRVLLNLQSRDVWVLYDRIWMLKRTEHLNSKASIKVILAVLPKTT